MMCWQDFDVAKGQELCDRLYYMQNGAGVVLAPLDCYLTIRGLKHSLRIECHQQNAKQIAAFLNDLDDVTDVLYPNKGECSLPLCEEKWSYRFVTETTTFCRKLAAQSLHFLSGNTNAYGYSGGGENSAVCVIAYYVFQSVWKILKILKDIQQALQAAKKLTFRGVDCSVCYFFKRSLGLFKMILC